MTITSPSAAGSIFRTLRFATPSPSLGIKRAALLNAPFIGFWHIPILALLASMRSHAPKPAERFPLTCCQVAELPVRRHTPLDTSFAEAQSAASSHTGHAA
jgi:hypothetical protein